MKNSFKSIIYNFIFILLIFKGYSQTSFKQLIGNGNMFAVGTIFQIDSGYIYNAFGGNYYDFLDINGNYKSNKLFVFNSTLAIGGFGSRNYFSVKNNYLNFIGAGNNGSSISSLLGLYNLTNNSFSWLKEINNIVGLSKNVGISNSILISATWAVPVWPYQYYPTLIYTDSSGNMFNSYRINGYKGQTSFAFQNADTSLIIGMNADTVGAAIVKMDTLGNIQWAKSYFRPKAAFHSAVHNMDGTITIIGSPDTVSAWMYGGFYHKAPLFIMKINESGSIIWCKSYGDSLLAFPNLPITQLKATNDGGYVICSTIRNLTTNKSDLIIIRTDNNGDTLWTRTHGDPESNEYGHDISLTNDGGYIICGHSDCIQFPLPLQNGKIYIIKTDSLGMTASHCQEFNTPFSVNNITPNDSNISLTVTTGIATSVNATVLDTNLSNPATGNGCQLTGISQVYSPNKHKILPTPNPTTGNFSLINGAATPPLKTLTVYDMFGHELFTRQNVKETEPALDLSHQAPGMYYIKIIQGQKVEVAKVVVE